MANYLFDTSALVKRYRAEVGTSIVDQVFGDAGSTVFTSRLGLVELCSAFSLKYRTGALPENGVDAAWQNVLADVERAELQVLRVLARHYRIAEELLMRYAKQQRLRSLDALHLAFAVDAVKDGHCDVFVTADALLCQLAKQEGLPSQNPLQWNYIP